MDFEGFAVDQYLSASNEVEHLAKDEWPSLIADVVAVYERVWADARRLRDMMQDQYLWGQEVNDPTQIARSQEIQWNKDFVAEAEFAGRTLAVAIDALNHVRRIAGQSFESWAEVRKATRYEPPPDITPEY